MTVFYEVVCEWSKRSIFVVGDDPSIEKGDRVVLRVEGMLDLGEVTWRGSAELAEGDEPEPEASFRRASEEDIQAFRRLRSREAAALKVFTEKIEEHQLPMKPLEVKFEEDDTRITFYFWAEHRVDFRALVRDLARIYHTRIELRQINSRQVVQRIGGYGSCGRQLCCASFLQKVPRVPAEAVRDQALSLNPSKLTGICGQLKCCLRYELDLYRGNGSLEDGEGGPCCGQECSPEKSCWLQEPNGGESEGDLAMAGDDGGRIASCRGGTSFDGGRV